MSILLLEELDEDIFELDRVNIVVGVYVLKVMKYYVEIWVGLGIEGWGL